MPDGVKTDRPKSDHQQQVKNEKRIARKIAPEDDRQQEINAQQAFENRSHRQLCCKIILLSESIADARDIELRGSDKSRLPADVTLDHR